MTNYKSTGQMLRELRGEKSLQNVSEALEISASALSMYESDERNPRDEVKIKLAHYYGTTVEALFFAPKVHVS